MNQDRRKRLEELVEQLEEIKGQLEELGEEARCL